ncbi:MAG: MATE family efflux transporter [Lachnospiraceae bacterium]|nr:MATE family efflux transporter [Lachnospiraceae bacterium]
MAHTKTRSANQSNEVDMTHGPLAGKIIRFALPLAASSMLQQMFNAADLAVVGRFASAEAMAAVGSNASVINLLVSIFVGLSIGATVLIASQIGAGNRKGISDAVHTVITLAFVLGVFLTAAGILLASPILRLMGAPDNVMRLAVLYLRIYFTGMPVILLYNYGSAVLRSRGDSIRPFYALVAAGILNVLLNLFFVAVLHLHVIGVALATVLSDCLSGGLILLFLLRESDEFRLDLKKLRLRKDYALSVFRIGVPAGIQGAVFSLSNVVIQSAVNSFGADCIAGMTAAWNFDSISFCLLNSFTQAAVTFTSQNYGAGDQKRCGRVYRLCLGIGLAMDIMLVILMQIFKMPLLHLFTVDEAVISYALVRLTYSFRFHFMCGTYEIPGGALRGLNRGLVPALISMLGTCAFRLIYVFLIFPSHRTPEALILVYPLSWVLTCIAMNTAYFIVYRRAFAHMKPAA